MKEFALKYGCNPNQKPARIFSRDGELPVEILCGRPGYINFMDALNAWQLVKELREATGLPAAASFKHVSPAGVGLAVPLSDTLRKAYFAGDAHLSPMATAYTRARGADRLSSFGDFAALSDECDESTARCLAREVSDGVIAPSYSPEALEILKTKRKGTYVVLKIDPAYIPPELEHKDIFGITFEQARNTFAVTEALFENIPTRNKALPDAARRDLTLAMIALKYTQSNSVCYAVDGQAIGIGAGQQSRVHCTRLAGNKADLWYLRQNPRVLELPFVEGIKRPERDNAVDLYVGGDEGILADGTWQMLFTQRPAPFTARERREWLDTLSGVSLGSDAFFPFGDNIERAHQSGVQYVAQAGGSVRDDNVIAACDKYDMVMAMTGVRLFHH